MKRLTLILITAFALLVQSPSSHADDKDHHDKKEHPEIKVPDKAADIFKETEKHLQQLAASIKSKDPKQVHHHDVTVRKLIGHIPQRATPDSKKDVNALVKDISDASKAAHKSAHDDDWTKAAAYVKHAQTSLAKLKTSFKEIPH